MAVSAAPASAACPNEEIRKEQGMTHLPDCMALEMVSPPDKQSRAAIFPSFSASGERVLFNSVAPLGGSTSLVNFLGDLYVATRGPLGWATSSTTAPGSFGFGYETRDRAAALTPDFVTWVTFVATQAQYAAGKKSIYQGSLADTWVQRSPLLEPLNDPLGIDFKEDAKATLKATSGDLSHLYFRSGGTESWLLPGDPVTGNTYLVRRGPGGTPALELLAREGDGTVWGGNCGAGVGDATGRNQGAVSTDGSRVLLSTRPEQEWDQVTHTGPACETANPVRILVREEGIAGAQIEELLPSAPAGGSDFFEGASSDQSKVYLTSSRPLAASDLDATGLDLYLYEGLPGGGSEIIQVSAGGEGDPSPGEGADVMKGVTAISSDGSHVYFVAHGVLTTNPNPEGDVAEAGDFNLYAYTRDAAHPSGRTAFVGELDSMCAPTDLGADCETLAGRPFNYRSNSLAMPMRGSGTGNTLVFEALAELTANDTDGRHRDVYRYQADSEPPTLTCVSCRPGGPDSEPFDVGGRSGSLVIAGDPGPEFAELERWASEDGGAIVFATREQLLPSDDDEAESPYLWLDGELTLLPGAKRIGSLREYRPVVAAAGDQVAFQSSRALIPQDIDSAEDIYVARSGGGFPPPAPEPDSCQGTDQCRDPISQGPAPTRAATAAFAGRGNLGEQRPRRRCSSAARAAVKHSRRAKRLRRAARRASVPAKSRSLRRAARRRAAQAKRLSGSARRCRNRQRQARRASR